MKGVRVNMKALVEIVEFDWFKRRLSESLTRKDFITMAKYIKNAPGGHREALMDFAIQISKADNPRFDEDRFRNAVLGQQTHNQRMASDDDLEETYDADTNECQECGKDIPRFAKLCKQCSKEKVKGEAQELDQPMHPDEEEVTEEMRCADCGQKGVMTGHQDCQFPQDHDMNEEPSWTTRKDKKGTTFMKPGHSFKCSNCGQQFTNRSEYTKHKLNVHPGK